MSENKRVRMGDVFDAINEVIALREEDATLEQLVAAIDYCAAVMRGDIVPERNEEF